jgi:hypothetical protein
MTGSAVVSIVAREFAVLAAVAGAGLASILVGG